MLAKLDYQPQVIFMSPHSLADIEGNLMELAEVTGTKERAERIVAEWRDRIEAVKHRTTARPRAFVMEWVDPIYCSGHWLAEMIDLAGGDDRFARKGADSVRIEWRDVLEPLRQTGWRKSRCCAMVRTWARREGQLFNHWVQSRG